jgi:hypothetical protein
MNFQSALENLAKVFIGFYIACACAGRPDIPLKLVTHLRAQALAGAASSWGCPIHKQECLQGVQP